MNLPELCRQMPCSFARSPAKMPEIIRNLEPIFGRFADWDWGEITYGLPPEFLILFKDYIDINDINIYTLSYNIEILGEYWFPKDVLEFGVVTNEIFDKYFDEIVKYDILNALYSRQNGKPVPITADRLAKYIDAREGNCTPSGTGKFPPEFLEGQGIYAKYSRYVKIYRTEPMVFSSNPGYTYEDFADIVYDNANMLVTDILINPLCGLKLAEKHKHIISSADKLRLIITDMTEINALVALLSYISPKAYVEVHLFPKYVYPRQIIRILSRFCRDRPRTNTAEALILARDFPLKE